MSRTYIIYDDKARYNDTDKATVLATANTLKEAKNDCKLFMNGPLFCHPLVYSYDNSGDFLTDKRLEYDTLGVAPFKRT